MPSINAAIRWSGALYFYRVPLSMSAALAGLAFSNDKSMVSGLFAVANWDSLALAFALALISGQLYMIMSSLQIHGPERLNMRLPDALEGDRGWARVIVSFVPSFGILCFLSKRNHGTWRWLLAGVAIGAISLLVVLWLSKVELGHGRKKLTNWLSQRLIVVIHRIDPQPVRFIRELTPPLDPKNSVLRKRILASEDLVQLELGEKIGSA